MGSDDRRVGSELLRRFCERMEAAGLPCHVSSYSRLQGMVRTVRVDWPQEWQAAIEADAVAPVSGGERIVFATGKPWSRRRQQAELAAERNFILQEMSLTECSQSTAEKVAYLNSRPTNMYVELGRRAETIIPRALELIQEPGKRAQALSVLGAIAEQPAAVWAPCERSARVRTAGASAVQLPRALRAELFRDYLVEFDLASAQIAVVARLWAVQGLLDLLRAGRCFWSELLSALGLTASAKAGIKSGTYSLCFGGSVRTIRSAVADELVPALGADRAGAAADGFLRLPLVRGLLRARRREILKIREAGGAHDVSGVWLRVSPRRPPHAILAAVAQSVEQALTWPAYQLARLNHREFSIAFDLADGFAVRFHNSGDAERWTRKLVDAVAERAADLGVPTYLAPKDARPKPVPAPAPAPPATEPTPAPERAPMTTEQSQAAMVAFRERFERDAAERKTKLQIQAEPCRLMRSSFHLSEK